MKTRATFDKLPGGRPFIKMHGLLNHFVIVDAREQTFCPSREEIVRICDVRRGVGADQLIVVEKATQVGQEKGASAFMRIFNLDGREAEACGNATRCVAWLLLEENGIDALTLETLAGLIECRRTGDFEVSCAMGRVSMDWRRVPLARPVDTCHVDVGSGPLNDGVALTIGNPHIVFFVDDLERVNIASLAPAIQAHELFPAGVNVGVAQMLSDDHVRSVVYERGAGLTAACGSGACVAAYAALARGLTDRRTLRVSMSAGDVTIAVSDDGVATMTGPVAYCFAGCF